jgi:hypothetical protein
MTYIPWGGVGLGGVDRRRLQFTTGRESSQPDGRVHNQGSCGCELSRLWGRKDGRVHNQARGIREEDKRSREDNEGMPTCTLAVATFFSETCGCELSRLCARRPPAPGGTYENTKRDFAKEDKLLQTRPPTYTSQGWMLEPSGCGVDRLSVGGCSAMNCPIIGCRFFCTVFL